VCSKGDNGLNQSRLFEAWTFPLWDAPEQTGV